MVASTRQRGWHSTLCLVLGSSGEAGRGKITERMLGCWDCDVQFCCSGRDKSDPPQVGSPWLFPTMDGTHAKALTRLPGGAAPALDRAGSAQPLMQTEQLGILLPCELYLLFFQPKCLSHLAKEASDQQQLAKQAAVMICSNDLPFWCVWAVPSRNTGQVFGELCRGRARTWQCWGSSTFGAVWGGSSGTWAPLHKHSL